jgi:myo-inositol-1-phosphate synthase
MPTDSGVNIASAEGRLGVLCVGLGAVATGLEAGLELDKKEGTNPICVTEYSRIRIGRRNEDEYDEPLIKDFLELADHRNVVFGAWDIKSQNAYETALEAKVFEAHELLPVAEELSSNQPMKAVFEQSMLEGITDGNHFKQCQSKMEYAVMLMEDIRQFKAANNCDRLVMLCVCSTEKYVELSEVHSSIEAFEDGLYNNDPNISPSMIYAYAAIMSGVPLINGTPNRTDIRALADLAETKGVPICGRDFKTGQTLVKTVLAAMFKARALGIEGWYSPNILGNRDGLALNDPGSFESKKRTKGDVLEEILDPVNNPELYQSMMIEGRHQVRIDYYEPAGDDKIAIDHIDFFGWRKKRMSIDMIFRCKDSVLAAAVAWDLIRLIDLAARAGEKGVQEQLSFFFKAPKTLPGLKPIHHLFEQLLKLTNWMRHLRGEDILDHLGRDYKEETV